MQSLLREEDRPVGVALHLEWLRQLQRMLRPTTASNHRQGFCEAKTQRLDAPVPRTGCGGCSCAHAGSSRAPRVPRLALRPAMAPPGNPVVGSSFLAQLHSLRETMAKVALSSEETSLLCAEALRLADDLQQRPSATPPGFDDGSAFRALQGTDELRLVTDLVSAADAICLMLTCRKLRDAVFARFPRTIGGRIPFESECKYVECEEVACKNARMRTC